MHILQTGVKALLIGLCGNPNVGKSTLFNSLTGLKQHTGNWPGKTVGSAVGQWQGMELVDTPGSYSLDARSAEEEVTRDFILFAGAERILMVADAANLRRSLPLLLQILELRGDVLLCLNLMDEAERCGIHIDIEGLSAVLGIPVLPMSAAAGKGLDALNDALRLVPGHSAEPCIPKETASVLYPLAAYLEQQPLPALWLARTLVIGEAGMCGALARHLCLNPEKDGELARLIGVCRDKLAEQGYDAGRLADDCAAALANRADRIFSACITGSGTVERALPIDRFLTHPLWGLISMLMLLSLVLWITMAAANVPSDWLCQRLFAAGDYLRRGLAGLGAGPALMSALFDGVWRTTAWVAAVMLPPMAVFYPLFTLLEDLGYLPRAAFYLDGGLRRCGACGKQGLCMMMGLGCNAVGVSGSRIIDAPRERLISQLTNTFMPCNGRFPLLIALLSIFFAGQGNLLPALLLVLLIGMGVLLTLFVSGILSATMLRGLPASFALEMPPYRKPQWKSVLLHSLTERTLPMLLRALTVAAPAGLLIWCLANVEFRGLALLQWLRGSLDGIGGVLCMDGAILLGFLLALPANEIALPSMLLIYTGTHRLQESASLVELEVLLRNNGWDAFTAAAVLIFTVCHWPCATTLRTIKRESGSVGYMILAAVLPTACGVILCAVLALFRRILVA